MKRDKSDVGSVLLVVALSAISGLALIAAFIFREGVPIIPCGWARGSSSFPRTGNRVSGTSVSYR